MSKKKNNPSLKYTTAEEVTLPVEPPSMGIKSRDWQNLKRMVESLSEESKRWEITFTVSFTVFLSFLIPAITTPGELSGWKAVFTAITVLFSGVAITSLISWQSEKNRNVTSRKSIINLMSEIESLYISDDNSSPLQLSAPSNSFEQSKQNNDTELLNDAIMIAKNEGKISTSMLQRKLRIGYARAARVIDEMERRGLIGEMDGSRPRSVLINEDPDLMKKAIKISKDNT